MNQVLSDLKQRRERLVAQASAERSALAQGIAAWRTPLSMADDGLKVIRMVKTHPLLMVGSALLPSVLKVGRVATWFRRGLVTWQVVRGLRSRARLGPTLGLDETSPPQAAKGDDALMSQEIE